MVLIDIRLYEESDRDAVVELSLLAWAPVFRSFEQVMGQRVFLRLYPNWRVAQSKAVEEMCSDPQYQTWVAEEDGSVCGFVVYEIRQESLIGEVHMLAMHPDYQNRGFGTELNRFALDQLRDAGMTLVEVGTGGDAGHAPARRSYEKAGYTALPLMRYYKVMEQE